MKLSIAIVSYNTQDELKECIYSIQKHLRDIEYEVIVVDNASTDGSPDMIKREFSWVRLIENKSNLFFASANNQAIRASNGEYILLLNSDTSFFDNSFIFMLEFMEKNLSVGAVGGRVLWQDGRLQDVGWNFRTPLFEVFNSDPICRLFRKKYTPRLVEPYKECPRDVVSDCFMLVRRAAIFDIGLYDERFKLYYTEDDLCCRLKKNGWLVYHFPGANVVHKLFSSVRKANKFRISWIILTDKLKYYRKYYGLPVALGVGFFLGVSLITQLFRRR